MLFRRNRDAAADSSATPAPRIRDRFKKLTLTQSLRSAFAGSTDDEIWRSVEDALIMADVGVTTSQSLIARARKRVKRSADEEEVLAALKAELVAMMNSDQSREIRANPDGLTVVMVVGVNGTGKTTTVGKLAHRWSHDGNRVVLGAADTFRAAAADQLATWAARSDSEIVRGVENGDPASVAFDAVTRAIESNADVVILDTAGRLHTKQGLMDELSKIRRVVERKAAINEVLLVLDATTGQNGLTQAKVFAEAVALTGVVLTKLDGSAKGGIVVAVQQELGVPVKYVGIGESIDDLVEFDTAEFVAALFG